MTDWSFSSLDQFVTNRGEQVIHEIAIACPCRVEDGYAGNIEVNGRPAKDRLSECTLCQGDGFRYRDSQIITGLVTSVQAGTRELREFGYAVPGDAVFSPALSSRPISDFDRITFQFPVPLSEGQTIIRNAHNLERNGMLQNVPSSDSDRLWYLPSCAIWCEDIDGVVYTEHADFTLGEKKITWVGNKPADGVVYTLKYQAYLEWIAYNTPLPRIDRNRSLAQRVTLRKKHVFFNDGSSAKTPAERCTEEREFTTQLKI